MIHLNLAFDNSTVIHLSNILANHPTLSGITRFIAVYFVYLVPIGWIVAWFWPKGTDARRSNLLGSILAGLLTWGGLNRIAKLIAQHPRPDTILPVHELLFSRPENSFPSDHTGFLIAIGTYYLLSKNPRLGWTFLVLGLIVGLSRIAVAVHYPTDIIGGIISGMIGGWIIFALRSPLQNYLYNPILGLAKKLHLA